MKHQDTQTDTIIHINIKHPRTVDNILRRGIMLHFYLGP